MSAPWTGTNAPAASSLATLSILSVGSGQVIRLRNYAVSVSGVTASPSTFQISDGSTVLYALDVAPPAAGGVTTIIAPCALLDYRTSSASNSMVIGFASGVSGITQKVNAEGDFVQIGVPAFASPQQA